MKKVTVWQEIKRQLTNAPSFAQDLEEIKYTPPAFNTLQAEQLEYIDHQIAAAINHGNHRMVFLLGPFGVGKTTQLHYFIRKRPQFCYVLRSFVKIKTLDHAFLHLANYMSRTISLLVFFCFALLLVWSLPASGAFPFLLIVSYLFVKNAGNLVYMFHQACDNLFLRQHRVVVLEDLERSSLEPQDQWAMLSNLWHLKRTYLVALGYSSGDQSAKFKALEYAQKLGGVIIEIMPQIELNFSLLKQLDEDVPFAVDPTKKGDWLTLFTPREIWTIYEQAFLRVRAKMPRELKKGIYINVCLEFLAAKLSLSRQAVYYDAHAKAIKRLPEKTLTAEQAYFIASFKESIQD